MTPLPIRARLTLWYFVVLAVTFAAFSFAAYYAVRHSIYTAVDDELRESAGDIAEAIRGIPPGDAAELQDKLQELGRERAAGNYLQADAADGSLSYRSSSISALHLSVSSVPDEVSDFHGNGLHLRLIYSSFDNSGRRYGVIVGTPMTEYDEALHRIEVLLFTFAPILLVVASLGGYLLSRRALSPVEGITAEARDIGVQNLSRRLDVPQTRDELQRLSETLNGMLERLDAAFQRITQFTADASHELRTPVAIMRARAELALRRPRPIEEYQDALAQIIVELDRTTDLLERLLLLARADSGAVSLSLTPMDLRDAARAAAEEVQPLADAKQIRFSSTIPESPVPVTGDSVALRRLLLILLDNAVKYSPESGSIQLKLQENNGHAVASVSDTGSGITEEDLPHIFDRFYRADKARSRAAGGAGLGLSIALWIAQTHGGTIQVESAPGCGSTFRLEIPIKR